MGISRVRSPAQGGEPGPAGAGSQTLPTGAGSQGPSAGPGGSPAAAAAAGVVEYAVGQLLHGANDAAEALPAVLDRLGAALGCHAVLALQQEPAQATVILAAHPADAAADAELVTELGALSAAHRGSARAGGSFEETLNWTQRDGHRAGEPPMRALMAYAAPADDHCLCAIALVGDGTGAPWPAEARPLAHTVAGILAAQIRHANDTAKLTERQALTSALIDGSPEAIVVAGPDRRIVTFNPAAEEIFDRNRDEVIGKSVAELLIPERNRAQFDAGTQSYLESGDRGGYTGSMRYPAMRPDGTERMTETTPVPLTVDGVVHFCAFIRDLSDLELAHDALTDSEARFRVLAKLAPVGIVQMDAGGLCTFANDRWCELTEMTEADAIGVGWASALHSDDAVRMEREWALAAARGTELVTECRLVSVTGREIWVQATAVPLLSAHGLPGGFLAAVIDVSARKRAEAERERLLEAERAARRSLADQTERLNSLIATAIPGIMVGDEHGRVTQVNRSFCDLFGLQVPTGQLAGVPAAKLADQVKDTFAEPAEFLRRTAALNAARQQSEGEQFSCADGRTIEGDYWPVVAEGEYRGDLWLFWDISDRKALEEQRDRMFNVEHTARDAAEQARQRFAEQNAKLQELDEAKTQFLATMSHELRAPLTSIVSFAELIADGDQQLGAGTLESLGVIRRNAERLLRLVGDLLLLSSAETGVLPLQVDLVSVPELVEESARAASASAAERGIVIDAQAAAGPALQADQLRLQQVLDNLLSNAIKFSDTDGLVTITATHDEQMWRIDVTDDGIGIPPDDIGRLFSRFVRAANAAAAGLPGTGLGLSVARAITELHGGRVEVQSTLGSGTTFSVYLPDKP
jgi:PAS domain S-box-containing protein